MITPADMTPDQNPEEDADDALVREVSAEDWTAIIARSTTTRAPRRFSLCRTEDPDADPVYGWGLAFEHAAVLFSPEGRSTRYISDSAERMHAALSRVWDMRLVWIDPAVSPA